MSKSISETSPSFEAAITRANKNIRRMRSDVEWEDLAIREGDAVKEIFSNIQQAADLVKSRLEEPFTITTSKGSRPDLLEVLFNDIVVVGFIKAGQQRELTVLVRTTNLGVKGTEKHSRALSSSREERVLEIAEEIANAIASHSNLFR